VVAWLPNVKPKAAEGVVAVDTEEDTESDGVPAVVEGNGTVDSEVDASSGRSEPVGIEMEGTMVPAPSLAEIPTEKVVEVPDVSAAQPVADAVTVDTTVTVTMLSVPMTTVGVTIPFDAEEEIETAVAALDVSDKTELGGTDEVAIDEVVAAVEADEDVKSWRRWRAPDAEDVGDSGLAVTVTVTVATGELLAWLLAVETPVELVVAAIEVGVAIVDEVESPSSSQS
jgi:hypothetical protein